MLDKLGEAEVKPWRKTYPEQTRQVDSARLKSIVADQLYHEIYARHGDPFILGKVGDKPRPQGVTSESGDGDLYCKWEGYFLRYQMHGGWYRPDKSKRNGVDPQEFNSFETANLQFLAGFVMKSQSQK